MSPKPWYGKGLRFECTACGECCRNHGEYSRVYVSDADVAAISDYLGLPRRDFLAQHTEMEDGWTILRLGEPQCQFLDDDNRCRIYPVRPKQCATWPFWEENVLRENWQGSVSDVCPGIDQGPLHSAEEIERSVRETEEWYGE